MNNIKKVLLMVVGMSFHQLQISGQVLNFTGTWRLNFENSKLEHRPSGLTNSVFVIRQEGDKFSLIRYHIFGHKKKRIHFTMVADGKTRPVKILFKGKLDQKESALQATLWRKNFLNIVTYTFGNTQDELIADETLKSKPNNHHNIWVFDREIPK